MGSPCMMAVGYRDEPSSHDRMRGRGGARPRHATLARPAAGVPGRRHPDHARWRPPRGDLRRPRPRHPEEHAEEGPARRGHGDLQTLLGGHAGRPPAQAAAVLLAAGHRTGVDRRQSSAGQRRPAVQHAAVLVSRLRRDPARPGIRHRDHLERSRSQPARDGARAAAARPEADARRRSPPSPAGTSSPPSPSTPKAPRRSMPATRRWPSMAPISAC